MKKLTKELLTQIESLVGKNYQIFSNEDDTGCIIMKSYDCTDQGDSALVGAIVTDEDLYPYAGECTDAIKKIAEALSAIAVWVFSDERANYIEIDHRDVSIKVNGKDFPTTGIDSFIRKCTAQSHMNDMGIAKVLDTILSGQYPDLSSFIIRSTAHRELNQELHRYLPDCTVTGITNGFIMEKNKKQ